MGRVNSGWQSALLTDSNMHSQRASENILVSFQILSHGSRPLCSPLVQKSLVRKTRHLHAPTVKWLPS